MAFNVRGLKRVNMILAGMVFIWLTLATMHAVAACWAVVSPSPKPLHPGFKLNFHAPGKIG